MTTTDEWFSCAVHECGHITSLLRWNYAFKSVRLWRSAKTGEVRGQVQWPNITAPDYLACAIRFLSGPLAAQRLTGVPPEQQKGAWDDLAQANDMLAKVEFPDDLDIEAIMPFTTDLIDTEWPMIQWLAAHLAERRELSYDDIVNLVQGA
jgi:hypothetical protein